MRRRGDDASAQAWALGTAASQIRAARRYLSAARDRSEDARGRAAIETMIADIEVVARRADAMRLRMNAKVASTIPDVTAPGS